MLLVKQLLVKQLLVQQLLHKKFDAFPLASQERPLIPILDTRVNGSTASGSSGNPAITSFPAGRITRRRVSIPVFSNGGFDLSHQSSNHGSTTGSGHNLTLSFPGQSSTTV
jgi:hypothetical protein